VLSYSLILTAAAVVSAASAGLIYAQAPRRRSSQLLAAILVLGAWWAGAELGVSRATSVEEALLWMRIGALGWVPLGALIPHLVHHALDRAQRTAFRPYRKLQAWNAAVQTVWSAAMLLLVWGSDLWVDEIEPRSWGWSGSPGGWLQLNFAVVSTGIACSSFVVFRSSRGASVAETLQLPWVWGAILVPSGVVFVTDVLLPGLGVDCPRFGGASVALCGAIVSWTVIHYGMSMLSPPAFGDEILEALEEGVALVSRDGCIVHANRALARLSGVPKEELIGVSMGSLVERDVDGAPGVGDMRRLLVHARGAPIPVSVSMAVLRERQDNELGVVIVVRDLRELEDLRRSSMVNARLAAVGELAAGLAHEINNPMAFIGANLRMLQGHWEKLVGQEAAAEERAILGSEGREIIEESLDGIERATDIVRRMKNFTHAGSGERAPAHVADLVHDCLKILRPQIGPRVEVQTHFAGLPPVVCCAPEIEQVFMNLLMNAVHAVEGEGSIEVSTRFESGLAVVSFRDDGRGMDSETLDRIFDPFFTTKPVGKGTGLGLAIAHQVVTQHRGVITVQSQPGEGTTFRVHLPAGDPD
jgi:PAS domain S-box-containing protein